MVGPEAASQAWEGWWESDHPATHVPARKSSPKGWVRWDKKKTPSILFRGFLGHLVKARRKEMGPSVKLFFILRLSLD